MLEEKIRSETGTANRFRSHGEKHIADTLRQYGIPFIYEPTVTVIENGNRRTLRPDFYLPESNLYIEYYGRVGNQDYDFRTAQKKTAYAANKLNVISLYPWDLIHDWPNYLLNLLRTPNSDTAPTQNSLYKSFRSPVTCRSYHTGIRPYRRTSPRPYR